VFAPSDYLAIALIVFVFRIAELPPAVPAPPDETLLCCVQCSTTCEEQSAEHSAAVLAAHATWELTDALTPQVTFACTVHVA
jgi:hypothetical protein